MNILISGILSRDSLPRVSLGSNNSVGLGFGILGAIMYKHIVQFFSKLKFPSWISCCWTFFLSLPQLLDS